MTIVSDLISLEPILSDEYNRNDIDTVKVMVGQLNDKKQISKVNDHLSVNFPISSLRHLKRINSKDGECYVIISIESNDKDDGDDDDERMKIDHLKREFNLLNIKILSVPLNAPLTRIQYNECMKLWPTNFHENKFIEKCLNGKLFDNHETQKIYDIMMKVIESKKEFPSSMVAIIADDYEIIAKGRSNIIENPLKHAVMVAIDQIATLHGGGNWHSDSGDVDMYKERFKKNKYSYLCSGFDVFLSQETCVMCSMALTHSRIKRLFFMQSNHGDNCPKCSDSGITFYKIHLLENLNHHYDSWRVKIKE